MPTVVVYTDKGQQVWQMDVESWQIDGLQCPTNLRGSSLAGGIRRAVQDAEVIQAGGDPERPSEKAIRLMHEERARASDFVPDAEGRDARFTRTDDGYEDPRGYE